MEQFNFSRLDVARRRRGMTKTKLADAAGIAPRTLRAYEQGERELTDEARAALIAAVAFPPEFFTGDDIDEPSLDGVSFRSLKSMTGRQRDQAHGSAVLATRLADWITERFDLPEVSVPRLRGEDPERAADAVRAAWGLGIKRAPNMVHLLEAHGVRVFSLAEEYKEVDAFSFWRGGVPFVFLNTYKSSEHSRMDAAHELGHLVLHYWGGPGGREAEDQAKTFGSAFVLPRRSVLADAPRGGSARQIIRAKRRWNVSAMALAYRMRKLDLLTEWQVRSAYIELTRLGYRESEPDGGPRESSRMLAKVFAALRDDGMTKSDVARTLDIPLAELDKIVFGLVMTQLDGGGAEPSGGTRPALRLVT
jgi:Zn-dependent peptidase ImmA (M78 family)/DNA-binding XRE family transcriptional regulator